MRNFIIFVFLKNLLSLFFLSCNSESKKVASYTTAASGTNLQCNSRITEDKNSCEVINTQNTNTKVETSSCKEGQVLVDGRCVDEGKTATYCNI